MGIGDLLFCLGDGSKQAFSIPVEFCMLVRIIFDITNAVSVVPMVLLNEDD